MGEAWLAMELPFQDRREAGRCLAERLGGYAGNGDAMVLGLPRGGVPVAFEVARALGAPLDVLVVRKLGVPGAEELAMGAIGPGGAVVVNERVCRMIRDAEVVFEQVKEVEAKELQRRELRYRGDRPPLAVRGKIVIVVDDGVATGASLRTALQFVRGRGAARCVAAVPVGSSEVCAELAEEADEVICAMQPENFQAVGEFYRDFSQTTDEEVCGLLGNSEGGS